MHAEDFGPALAFWSVASAPDELRLLGVRGKEAISTLFEIDLLLLRPAGPLSEERARELLATPCAFVLGRVDPEIVHGVLDRIELVDFVGASAVYRARLVPNLGRLGVARASRVFHDVTVPAMVAEVLGSSDVDFEILAGEDHVAREYVVQSEETDLAFLERWMEREGLYYWFEHGAGSARFVVADDNGFATPIEPPARIRYRARDGLHEAEETVSDLTIRDVRGPAGAAGRTFFGASDSVRLRVGHSFEIAAELPTFEGAYLVVSLDYEAGLAIDERGAGEYGGYRARFSAIPLAVQYRPEIRTPWPAVAGLAERDGAPGEEPSLELRSATSISLSVGGSVLQLSPGLIRLSTGAADLTLVGNLVMVNAGLAIDLKAASGMSLRAGVAIGGAAPAIAWNG